VWRRRQKDLQIKTQQNCNLVFGKRQRNPRASRMEPRPVVGMR
jgi:hypothetical protein